MTAPKVSRDVDVQPESECRIDSSHKRWNTSRWSALLSAGLCLLLAGLTTGCEKASAQDQIGGAQAALVPPPPVNQNIGIYDRTFTSFQATDCLGCHDPSTTDPTVVSDVVTLRHHMMLNPSSPRYKPQYECFSCHQPDGTSNMNVTLNCPTCHTGTPHHKSAPAQARHCAACHGSVVNNFDDGHYVPTYKKSIVTPDPNCRTWSDASRTTCVSGGCRACHVASTAITPNTWNNDQTHHGTGFGQGGAGSANPPEQCGWCHNIGSVGGVPTPAIDIRTCETCHGPTSLHGIEFQYDTNKGNLGYGHIGAPLEDCGGCHPIIWRYALPPSFGPTIPTIDSIAPMVAEAGVATQITLTGQSFTNTVVKQNKTYAPEVVLSVFDDARTKVASYVILPDSVTQAEVKFTIPTDVAFGIWNVRIFKARGTALEVNSNDLPIAVVRPKVTIASATVCNGAVRVTVDDLCLLPNPPKLCFEIPPLCYPRCPDPGCPGPGCIWMWVDNRVCTLVNWSNNQMVGTCPNTTIIGAQLIIGNSSGLLLKARLVNGCN